MRIHLVNCISISIPQFFFFTSFSLVFLVLKLLDHSRFDIFFCLPPVQISPGQKLHEHPLKRTKPNFGTNKAMASSTWRGWNYMLYTNFFRCHNRVLTDVRVLGFWQPLCVHCPHVKVTSEHSDDTLEWLSPCALDWMNCTGRWECVRKL